VMALRCPAATVMAITIDYRRAPFHFVSDAVQWLSP
jgi:hypothetical protein